MAKKAKADAYTHFMGQVILGILQMVAAIGYSLFFYELFGYLFTNSVALAVGYLSTVIFLLVHGFWRIVENYVRWRNAK